MGFNYYTLLQLPFGLLLPIAVIVFFVISKNRKHIAYDSVAYGLGAFLGSMVAVFVAFLITNLVFLSGMTFEDDTSGLSIAGTVIAVMIVILFVFCESFKMMTLKKFMTSETRTLYSSLGFSAGVILAQNVAVFIALNIFDKYSMEPGYAVFSGLFIFATGIMYTVLSYAAECALRLGSRGAAYAISAVYYLYWIAAIICVRSSLLIYIVSAAFFVFSLVLSGVFFMRSKKTAGE